MFKIFHALRFLLSLHSLLAISFAAVLVLAAAPVILHSQPVDRSLYLSMKWRMIGPFRGGRTVGAVGIPTQPNIFYIGVNNGGVWKTTDAGRTWKPIFDEQPTGSIGDIAIAPSNPNVIYVGSGEGLQRPDLSTGDGMYRSDDGGSTWQHLGLREGQQIASIVVRPAVRSESRIAALGQPLRHRRGPANLHQHDVGGGVVAGDDHLGDGIAQGRLQSGIVILEDAGAVPQVSARQRDALA